MSANLNEFKDDPTVVALTPVLESVRRFATGLVIKSADSYEQAAGILKNIKGSLAQIEDSRTRITKPINESLREINAQAKEAARPFIQDETVIKNAMIRYSNEQEDKRREEQRKANEAAAKEQQRLRDLAAKNAAKGNEAKAEALEDRASQVVAPVIQREAPKVGGISMMTVWDFVIEDESLVPVEYRPVSDMLIRAQVRATKGLTKIPGVKVFEKKQVSAGRS